MLVLCVPLEIVGHELFKRKDHMAEKGVRQAPGERLLRAVHHDDEIREPRERGIGALGERHDLVAVLAGVAHVVEHRLWLTANMTLGAASSSVRSCAEQKSMWS